MYNGNDWGEKKEAGFPLESLRRHLKRTDVGKKLWFVDPNGVCRLGVANDHGRVEYIPAIENNGSALRNTENFPFEEELSPIQWQRYAWGVIHSASVLKILVKIEEWDGVSAQIMKINKGMRWNFPVLPWVNADSFFGIFWRDDAPNINEGRIPKLIACAKSKGIF